jgi:hypothetical protein
LRPSSSLPILVRNPHRGLYDDVSSSADSRIAVLRHLVTGEIKSEDAVYVLAYSIIMLNTDLFNPQNRTRMSFEDYRRNLRGVNAGADFSDAFLVRPL